MIPPEKPPQIPNHVAIVLCTLDAGAHLQAQLDSYLAQEHRDWSLWVSDDGSRDETRDILARFARDHGARHPLRLWQGPARGGSAANFLSALCHPDLPTDAVVAISDQDDVWLPHKLSRGLAMMAAAGPGGPLLYSAQSLHTDAGLRVIGASHRPRRAPGFANALVQNVTSGHSMLLSPEALALVRSAGPVAVPFHDWWLSQLIAGAGGRLLVDDAAVLLYRQHGANVLGAHEGLRAALHRVMLVFGRAYGGWIRANLAALAANSALLDAGGRAALAQMQAALARPGPAALRHLARAGIRRQTGPATALLYLAAAFGRL